MSSINIPNAAPNTYILGTNDVSGKTVSISAEQVPTLLPLVMGYAKMGPTTPEIVVGDSRTQMYDADSFDLRMAWANHATVLSNTLNSAACAQMFQRIVPDDADPEANFRIYADVLATQVPEYKRNSDGSIVTDSTGAYVATGATITGYQVKFVAVHIGLDSSGTSLFGAGTITAGDQTDGTNTSQRYPVMDIQVSHQGAYGNNVGLRMWANTQVSANPVSTSCITTDKFYPFYMQCVSRTDSASTPTISNTTSGATSVMVTFMPGAIDSQYDAQRYVGDIFLDSYQSLESTDGTPDVYGPFGDIHIYDSYIAQILELLYAAEKPYIDAYSDFTGEDDEYYRFNMLGGVSSYNVPYHSYQLITTASNSVLFSSSATMYATGGSDGTMSLANFATSVGTAMADWGSADSEYYDMAEYPVTTFWDSGFPLATKYLLTKFISARKDTFVFLGTHDAASSTKMTADEDSSVALALKTHLQNYPESDYFGTPVMRGAVFGRSGTLISSQYKGRLPMTIEVANMFALYQGASNGIWKSRYSVDEAPNNQLSLMKDINVTWTPLSTRQSDWSNGLNWVEYLKRRTLYFPAFHTVYSDDTSVLTSVITALFCCELIKVGDRARRYFSSNSKYTKAQMATRIDNWITSETKGRFDGRFIITPSTIWTTDDTARGYSYSTTIKFGANNAETVMSLALEAWRQEDMTTTTTTTTG